MFLKIPRKDQSIGNFSSQLCLMWKRGIFGTNVATDYYQNVLIPLLYKQDTGNDFMNRLPLEFFQTNNFADDFIFRRGRWVYKEKDNLIPWLSYTGMRKRLVGFHYIFQGDSLMRQMFNRLVNHVRGIDIVIEHYYHLDSIYSFNETQDLISINDSNSSTNSVENSLFKASFVWDPMLDRDPPILTSNMLLIVGLHHWSRDTPAFEKLTRFNTSRTVFVTTPTTYTYDDTHWHNILKRNEWIQNNSNIFIPLADMANTHAFETNLGDPFHFQCGYLSRDNEWRGYLQPVLLTKNEIQYKAPSSGDCRDMVNLNCIMLLIFLHRFLQTKQ